MTSTWARVRPPARRAALTGVKTLAQAADRVRTPPSGVVILIYHRVGGRSGSEIDMPTALFDEQMAHLAASGRAVSLDAALEMLAGGPRTVADPVVVTFDDGTVDFTEQAVPVLVAHQVPATLYLATDFAETGRSFPAEGRPVSWSALAEAVSTSLVTVGSHTHTHALLDRLDGPAAEAELDRSIDLIGQRLGVAARHFAHPKAVAGSDAAEAAIARRFASAALAGSRANPFGATNPHRLARTPIQVSDRMRWFEAKAAGGMAMEDSLRRILNRGRYAGATT